MLIHGQVHEVEASATEDRVDLCRKAAEVALPLLADGEMVHLATIAAHDEAAGFWLVRTGDRIIICRMMRPWIFEAKDR
jgi:hypothetical protein